MLFSRPRWERGLTIRLRSAFSHVNLTPKTPKMKNGGHAICRKCLILLVEQRGLGPPDLRIALQRSSTTVSH